MIRTRIASSKEARRIPRSNPTEQVSGVWRGVLALRVFLLLAPIGLPRLVFPVSGL